MLVEDVGAEVRDLEDEHAGAEGTLRGSGERGVTAAGQALPRLPPPDLHSSAAAAAKRDRGEAGGTSPDESFVLAGAASYLNLPGS